MERRPAPHWLLAAASALLATSALAAALPSCAPLTTRPPPALVLPPALPGAPTAPGPSPRLRAFDAAAVNARCEACHTEIASEWRASLHRQAHTDPTYQRQFAREPFPFCTGCHAPEAAAAEPVPEALSHLGVGCVTCHVAGDRILAAPKSGGTDHDGEHHPLTRTEAFEGPAACGACHEFAFPGPRRGKEPLLMQSTMKEHAASPHAERSCASCHMPVVPGGPGGRHRSHAFSASRDEAFVRSAVLVEEGPFVDGALTLTLRPGPVGHAFPTGDLLRRLALVIEVLDGQGKPVEREERFLARHFSYSSTPTTPPRRVLVSDDRVGAGPGPVVIRLSAKSRPPGGSLRYTLRYERVGEPGGGEGGRDVVHGSVLLAEKAFALPPIAPP